MAAPAKTWGRPGPPHLGSHTSAQSDLDASPLHTLCIQSPESPQVHVRPCFKTVLCLY